MVPLLAVIRSPRSVQVPESNSELYCSSSVCPGVTFTINFLGEPTVFAGSVAYSVCYLQSETDQSGVQLKVGADTRSKVYLNGVEIYRANRDTSFTVDQHVTNGVQIKAGLNVLVFKVVSGARWLGSVRLMDADDRPLKGNKVTLTPP